MEETVYHAKYINLIYLYLFLRSELLLSVKLLPILTIRWPPDILQFRRHISEISVSEPEGVAVSSFFYHQKEVFLKLILMEFI